MAEECFRKLDVRGPQKSKAITDGIIHSCYKIVNTGCIDKDSSIYERTERF
jgi:hypothetical protein